MRQTASITVPTTGEMAFTRRRIASRRATARRSVAAVLRFKGSSFCRSDGVPPGCKDMDWFAPMVHGALSSFHTLKNAYTLMQTRWNEANYFINTSFFVPRNSPANIL